MISASPCPHVVSLRNTCRRSERWFLRGFVHDVCHQHEARQGRVFVSPSGMKRWNLAKLLFSRCIDRNDMPSCAFTWMDTPLFKLWMSGFIRYSHKGNGAAKWNYWPWLLPMHLLRLTIIQLLNHPDRTPQYDHQDISRPWSWWPKLVLKGKTGPDLESFYTWLRFFFECDYLFLSETPKKSCSSHSAQWFWWEVQDTFWGVPDGLHHWCCPLIQPG